MSLIKTLEIDLNAAHREEETDHLLYEYLEQRSLERDEKSGKLAHPWKFESPRGFFKQREPDTDEVEFNYLLENFGLRLPSWGDLKRELQALNASAKPNESYKLLFLARHGQGYHNYAVLKYGTEEWNKTWAQLETDGEIVWGPDPLLTELGVAQAKENNRVWKEQLSQGAPFPQRFYSSPFTRSCETLVHTWSDLALKESPEPQQVLVKEVIREQIGVNLCDKRSPRSVTESRFARHGFVIEDGFVEEDELFTTHHRETLFEQVSRLHDFLQFLFEQEWDGTNVTQERDEYVSVTSHAGTTKCLLLAAGHNRFATPTGSMIPLIVKGTRQYD